MAIPWSTASTTLIAVTNASRKSCRCWVPASAAFPPERRHMSNSLTIALSKGRILDDTLPLLKLAGIEPVEDLNKSRKLIFGTTDPDVRLLIVRATDRKSTRLNSSHVRISYAVFCLKKKKKNEKPLVQYELKKHSYQ